MPDQLKQTLSGTLENLTVSWQVKIERWQYLSSLLFAKTINNEWSVPILED